MVSAPGDDFQELQEQQTPQRVVITKIGRWLVFAQALLEMHAPSCIQPQLTRAASHHFEGDSHPSKVV
jgi:hypothetical protein